MASLLLRNLFFTILLPGLAAGVAPYYILGDALTQITTQSLGAFHYFAMIVFTTGFIIMLNCILRFAVEGKGTLSPVDPTRRLVTGGLYRLSRNPMYVGVMLILMGEATFFWSGSLWIYAFFIFLAFNAFILLHEEPRLRKDFGEEYSQYCKKVRRWI